MCCGPVLPHLASTVELIILLLSRSVTGGRQKKLGVLGLRAKISKNRQCRQRGANLFPGVPPGETMTSERKLSLDKC